MSDPKQRIYNAMNCMGGTMPPKIPDDSQLVINAYEKVYTLQDQDTQRLFLDVIQRLRVRGATIENVVSSWDKSVGQLREACDLLDAMAAKKNDVTNGLLNNKG